MDSFIVNSTDEKSIKEAKKRFGEILSSTCEEFATMECDMQRRFETVRGMVNVVSYIVKARLQEINFSTGQKVLFEDMEVQYARDRPGRVGQVDYDINALDKQNLQRLMNYSIQTLQSTCAALIEKNEINDLNENFALRDGIAIHAVNVLKSMCLLENVSYDDLKAEFDPENKKKPVIADHQAG